MYVSVHVVVKEKRKSGVRRGTCIRMEMDGLERRRKDLKSQNLKTPSTNRTSWLAGRSMSHKTPVIRQAGRAGKGEARMLMIYLGRFVLGKRE